VVAAQSVFTTQPADSAAWKQQPAGGGVLLDLLSHHADAARWLLGSEVEAVAARERSVLCDADTAAVRMRMASGVDVQTLVSNSAADDHRFEITGSRGRIAIDPWSMPAPLVLPADGGRRRAQRLRRLELRRLLHRPDYHRPFRGALEAFADAVRTGQATAPSLDDGMASLAVVDAARRAAASGEEEAVMAAGAEPAGRIAQ
jgi:myo-inositol 2-dehydrogenase/D-chiro-inositol 1-dehydrogenase